MPTPRAQDTQLLSLDPPQHQEVLQLALTKVSVKGEGRREGANKDKQPEKSQHV